MKGVDDSGLEANKSNVFSGCPYMRLSKETLIKSKLQGKCLLSNEMTFGQFSMLLPLAAVIKSIITDADKS